MLFLEIGNSRQESPTVADDMIETAIYPDMKLKR